MNELLAGGPTVTLIIVGVVVLGVIAAVRLLTKLVTKVLTIIAIAATGTFGAGGVNNFDLACVTNPQSCASSHPTNGANR